jgi:hypothetical protein
MDNDSRILKAIMERYGSLSTLRVAMYEDTDTVLVNLADDLNSGDGSSDEIFEEEVLIYIHRVLG